MAAIETIWSLATPLFMKLGLLFLLLIVAGYLHSNLKRTKRRA